MPGRECWDLTEEAPRDPGDGEVLVKVLQVSLDPAVRGWMNDVPSYVPPVGLGEVMRAGTAGIVVESKTDRLAPRGFVGGGVRVRGEALAGGTALAKGATRTWPPPPPPRG